MLRIKEFSRLCHCSIYKLRYYDQVGILRPMYVDKKSGYRFYDENQKNEYIEINELQEIGFHIQEIKVLKDANYDEIENVIEKRIQALSHSLDKASILKKKYVKEKAR